MMSRGLVERVGGRIRASRVYKRLIGVSGRARSPRWGTLRTFEPVSRQFGFDRGLCIDRYYIERFLGNQSADIRGDVLEVADNSYTTRFGGDRVSRSHVLHAVAGNPSATLVGDLESGAGIPDEAFDCAILTQVLPFVYDIHGAVRAVYRSLKPGGVVLATFAGISQISRFDMERWGDFWRFTSLSARRLFEEAFPPDTVSVQACGNLVTSMAFLQGMAAHELTAAELDHQDPDYEMLLCVMARRPAATAASGAGSSV